jgi:phosphatidylglycerophosphate synthase
VTTAITSAARAGYGGPAAGLAALLALLALLAATAGVGVAGGLAGSAYGLLLCAALTAGLRRAGMAGLGPANRVTLARAVLVGGVTALIVRSFGHPVPTALLVTLVGVALALDGVDGQVARRTGSTSPLGARFDMEVDAFLVLMLSVYVAGSVGWWTVALGAFRYAFGAAAWPLPWLGAPLPPRFSRKVVAAVQGVVLVVVTAGVLPPAPAAAAVGAALASLTWSFGHDVRWLWHAERARRAAAHAAARRAAVLRPAAAAAAG